MPATVSHATGCDFRLPRANPGPACGRGQGYCQRRLRRSRQHIRAITHRREHLGTRGARGRARCCTVTAVARPRSSKTDGAPSDLHGLVLQPNTHCGVGQIAQNGHCAGHGGPAGPAGSSALRRERCKRIRHGGEVVPGLCIVGLQHGDPAQHRLGLRGSGWTGPACALSSFSGSISSGASSVAASSASIASRRRPISSSKAPRTT